jgi:hypothetical protein
MVSVRVHRLPASRKAAARLLPPRVSDPSDVAAMWMGLFPAHRDSERLIDKTRQASVRSRPNSCVCLSNPCADGKPRRGCAASGSSIAPVGIAGGMSRMPLRHRFRLTRGDRLWELSTVNNLSGRRERLQALLFHATKTA